MVSLFTTTDGNFKNLSAVNANIGNLNATNLNASNFGADNAVAASLSVGDMTYPSMDGSAGQFLVTDGSGNLNFQSVDIPSLPASSTNDAIVRFDGTTGDQFQNSSVTIDDLGNMIASGLTLGALSYPSSDGQPGQVLATNGSGTLAFQTPVTGPNVSTNDAVVRFNGTSGDIQGSSVIISDSGIINASGLVLGTLNYPAADGSAQQFIQTDGSGNLSFASAVQSSGASSDKALVRFNGASGNMIQNSGASLSDAGVLNSSGLIVGPLTYPATDGTTGQFMQTDGSGNLSFGTGFSGPTSSTDHAVARFHGTNGSVLQDSNVLIDDNGNLMSAGLTVGKLMYPSMDGVDGQMITTNGSGVLSFVNAFSGPSAASDKAIVRFNGNSGDLAQNSSAFVSDSGSITASGLTLGALNYPSLDGTAGQSLQTDGSGNLKFGNTFAGPASSTDRAAVRFDGMSGELVKDSSVLIDD
jgi:hypothetical protein